MVTNDFESMILVGQGNMGDKIKKQSVSPS